MVITVGGKLKLNMYIEYYKRRRERYFASFFAVLDTSRVGLAEDLPSFVVLTNTDNGTYSIVLSHLVFNLCYLGLLMSV